MNKSDKICKYQLKTSIKSILIYYSIFISVFLILAVIMKLMFGDFSTSGIEMSTAIFIFVAALNSFKQEFYFSQGNNISRKSFLIGTIKYGVIMAASLSLIDLIINRVYNNFVQCPTIFDMIYRTIIHPLNNSPEFIVNNSISNLFATYMWIFALYVFLFSLGLLITMSFFRLNKLGKVILSCGMVVLFIFLGNFYKYIPTKIFIFIDNAFGLNSKNSYMAVLTLTIISALISGAQYLLIKKAVPYKE